MENEEIKTIPYAVHEGVVARQERTIKRLWILCILIFVCLIGTNAAWIFYEMQYEDVTVTQEVTQDSGEGGSNTYNGKVVGGDYYGEAESKDNGEVQTEKSTEGESPL